MPLSDEDVRTILRLIDGPGGQELQVQTERFSLYVRRAVGERVPPGEPEASAVAAPILDGSLHTVSSPMLGTFYRSQAPGAAPFVDVGTRVESDTIVCLIEVMKMMNSVPAGVVGTVVEVCAENAQLVEDGAPLFQVRPDQ